MRPIADTRLWLGHSGDARDLLALNERGIQAVVDLAREEPPPHLSRELVLLRYPLLDGGGNPSWLLEMAVESVERLLRQKVRTLVACAGGLSRSPVVAAAALVRVQGRPLETTLREVTQSAPADVTPGLLTEVRAVLNGRDRTR